MDGRGTQSFTKFCPACKLGNDANAVKCKHCGASLDLISARVHTTERGAKPASEYAAPSKGVTFYFAGNTTPISTATDEEFILGRKADGQSEALVDLTDPDGFAMGVSRRHAMVRLQGNGYVIIDLNSSNGTWVDGKILTPTQPHDLPSGGTIQLGRLKLVAIYNARR
jgi:hypothetical protein